MASTEPLANSDEGLFTGALIGNPVPPAPELAATAETALRLARDAEVLVLDTETTGVDWKRNFPVGYVLGADDTVVYVPIRHGGGGNLPGGRPADSPVLVGELTPHPWEQALATAIAERTKPIVGHHLKFDAHMCWRAGIRLGDNLYCTQTCEALLDEYAKSYALAAVAERHRVAPKLKEEMTDYLATTLMVPNDKSVMSHLWRLPGTDETLTRYACGDGITTLAVRAKQLPLLAQQGLETVAQLENELLWTLVRMERRGVRVDEAALAELLKFIEAEVEQAYELLPDGFNPRSPKSVRAYVEQHRTDWPTTDRGNPSFPEWWLSQFREGQHIVRLRKWSNLRNSFALPLLDRHLFQGRVHATLNSMKADEHGTVSGRLSCSNPNLQQVPKHDKDLARAFRRVFVADEGYDFCEADYSQCEPRLFAHYSREPALVEGYSADPPRDVHDIVAKLFNADRQTTAKRMNMAMLTGVYPKSLAFYLGVDLAEGQRLWNQWNAHFPQIRQFREGAEMTLRNRGHVRTLLGRRGRLDQPKYAYRATSKIIQGGNADIMKWKLREIDRALGSDIKLYMTVHDSIVFGTPRARPAMAEEVVRIMTEVQGEPFNLRIPFAVDIGRGATWEEASL